MCGKVDQFAVITAQPGIRMWSTITSWAASTKPGSDWIGLDRITDRITDHITDQIVVHITDLKKPFWFNLK